MAALRVLVRDLDGQFYPVLVIVCKNIYHDSTVQSHISNGLLGTGQHDTKLGRSSPDQASGGGLSVDTTCGGLDADPGGGGRRRRYRVSTQLAGLVVRELRCCPATCAAIDHHNGGRLRLRLTEQSAAPLETCWGQMLQHQLWERRELDHMLSWLSTLGGAFSALGDYFTHCSVIAGRISLKQLELALRLGDPATVARCKLYAALSLLQRGSYETAAALVRQQYKLPAARRDHKLRNMCRGVWAKLQYERGRQAAPTR